MFLSHKCATFNDYLNKSLTVIVSYTYYVHRIILLASFFLFHALTVEGSHVYFNCRHVYHNSTSARAEMSLMAVCATSNSHVQHKGRDYEDSGSVAALI